MSMHDELCMAIKSLAHAAGRAGAADKSEEALAYARALEMLAKAECNLLQQLKVMQCGE